MSEGHSDAERPLLIIDAANVVGSVPDGWWRDRAGAAERLRDALREVASTGLDAAEGVPAWATRPPLEVVLVVEGAARAVRAIPGVHVRAAAGSGDDAIVDLVRAAACPTPANRPAPADPTSERHPSGSTTSENHPSARGPLTASHEPSTHHEPPASDPHTTGRDAVRASTTRRVDGSRTVQAEGAGGRRCLVVTADRELRGRVIALGASVVGPRAIRPAAS